MVEVKIPFMSRFQMPMLNGIKVMTCRTTKLCEVNDTFTQWGVQFIVTEVKEMPLFEVAQYHWFDEGCCAKYDFINVWNFLHRVWTYESNCSRLVWAHFFKMVIE